MKSSKSLNVIEFGAYSEISGNNIQMNFYTKLNIALHIWVQSNSLELKRTPSPKLFHTSTDSY